MQGLCDAHKLFKDTLGDADEEHRSIVDLAREIQRIAQQFHLSTIDNPYTPLDDRVVLLAVGKAVGNNAEVRGSISNTDVGKEPDREIFTPMSDAFV